MVQLLRFAQEQEMGRRTEKHGDSVVIQDLIEPAKPEKRILPTRSLEADQEFSAVFAGKKIFKLGDSSPATAVLKDALQKLGVEMDLSTAKLTESDIAHLREYQRRNGFEKIDGKVGRETIEWIDRALQSKGYPSLPGGFDPTLLAPVHAGQKDGPGERTVKTAQRALNMIFGSGKLIEDGDLGPASQALVRRYQKARPGLEVTGELDEKTVQSLKYDLGVMGQERSDLGKLWPNLDAIRRGDPIAPRDSITPQHAEMLADLLSGNGKLSRPQEEQVVAILYANPEMPALRSEFANATNGKNLWENLQSHLSPVMLAQAQALYGAGMGYLSNEQAQALYESSKAVAENGGG